MKRNLPGFLETIKHLILYFHEKPSIGNKL